ncbi:hypothetical protein L1987_81350 [Smallanthus sonchifolius]|uniref:Uncharacterized protein n=1 Tax=Smallanthus sonchifolius TaxID=185202 RepID=A0ACB8YQ76_9ASTR|nr:hypothetical protein L1987_81350 [Smallanthus sonchifolius]
MDDGNCPRHVPHVIPTPSFLPLYPTTPFLYLSLFQLYLSKLIIRPFQLSNCSKQEVIVVIEIESVSSVTDPI